MTVKKLKLLFAVCSVWQYDLPALPHAYVHTFYPFMGLRGKAMTGSSAANTPWGIIRNDIKSQAALKRSAGVEVGHTAACRGSRKS